MTTALALLIVQGCLGALDTLFYHELKLRLPHTPTAQTELFLHASRDFVYAIIFASLAWGAFNGMWAWPLAALLLVEISVTLGDFVQEDKIRDVPAGERVMHALMGIIYGAFLACFIPEMVTWAQRPTSFARQDYGWMSWLLTLMSAGVLFLGLRDISAAWSRRSERRELQHDSV